MKLRDFITQTATDIAEIKADLREHMRRTEIAEESINLLRSEVKPLETFKARCEGALKLVGGLCLVGGLLLGFLRLFK